MVHQITGWFWWALGASILVLALYVASVVAIQRPTAGAARSVRVEHLREPLAAALNFLAIAVALVAAVSGYLASQNIMGSANLLILSIGFFIVAGLVIVWFLLGLPNLAGTEETITFRFPRDWDVVVWPNLAKLLIILGLLQLGGYLLFELRLAPGEAGQSDEAGRPVVIWTDGRPCVVNTEVRGQKLRIEINQTGGSQSPNTSPWGLPVGCIVRSELPREITP